ncbi:uncharacterized protein [Penaeus vannamei]|uniref:uncharacterized protein n=1 Tax=Penaeus vannamei TaxID=6689 RepID=UPI00387F6137
MAVCRERAPLNTCLSKARSSSSGTSGISRASKSVLFTFNKRSVRSMPKGFFEDCSDCDCSHKTVTKDSKNGQESPMMCGDDENILQVGHSSKLFSSTGNSSQSEDSDSSVSSYESRRRKREHPSPDTTTVEARDSKKVRSVAFRVSHGSSSDGDSAGQDKTSPLKSVMDYKGHGHDCESSRKKKAKKREGPDSCKVRTKRESESARKFSKKRRSPSSERTMPRSSRSQSPYRSREPCRSQPAHHHARCLGERRTSWPNYKRDFNSDLAGRRDVRVGCRSAMGHNLADITHLNGAVSLTRAQGMMQAPILTCHHCSNSVAMSSCLCGSQSLPCTSPDMSRCRIRDSNPFYSSTWNMDCKVYIGNLGENATRSDIREAFSKYGRLKNLWIAKKPPGFAFVEYERPRDARLAVREAHGRVVSGGRIKVQMSTSDRHTNEVVPLPPRPVQQPHHEPWSRNRFGRTR